MSSPFILSQIDFLNMWPINESAATSSTLYVQCQSKESSPGLWSTPAPFREIWVDSVAWWKLESNHSSLQLRWAQNVFDLDDLVSAYGYIHVYIKIHIIYLHNLGIYAYTYNSRLSYLLLVAPIFTGMVSNVVALKLLFVLEFCAQQVCHFFLNLCSFRPHDLVFPLTSYLSLMCF